MLKKPELLLIITVWILIHNTAAAQIVDPPAADETLIYFIRDNAAGAGGKAWISVNDQTLAALKEKRYTVMRAKSGTITLNSSIFGGLTALTTLDDRHGETVFLRWKMLDPIEEITANDAAEYIDKWKLAKPVEPRTNDLQAKALMNPQRLGLDVSQPATARLEPDEKTAVVTFVRLRDRFQWDFGIWSEEGLHGSIGPNQSIEVRVSAGEHIFLCGARNISVLRANLVAGRKYYVSDEDSSGPVFRFTPILSEKSDQIDNIMAKVDFVALDPNAMTERMRDREAVVIEYVRNVGKQLAAGEVDHRTLGSAHAL